MIFPEACPQAPMKGSMSAIQFKVSMSTSTNASCGYWLA